MELFDTTESTTFEKYIIQKARSQKIPVGGTLELLPLCNLNCKMCYIRMNRQEMDNAGRMLSADQWISILEDAKRTGVLFLLLTGGEPLLYPEFEKLYLAIHAMGFVVTVNTNGTLFDDHWIDLFREHPCRRLNITLYGPDEETYGKLCGNSQGFLRIMDTAKKLNQYHIPYRFNASVTPQNIDKVDQMKQIADDFGVGIQFASYMFPPHYPGREIERISPEEAAAITVRLDLERAGDLGRPAMARSGLEKLKEPIHSHAVGYGCSVGRNGFWMNWKGELQCCGMIAEPSVSLLEHPLSECFQSIVNRTQKFDICAECEQCNLRNLCDVCFASCYTETGTVEGKPDYLCRETKEKIRILLKEIPEAERAEYRKLLADSMELRL